MLGESSVVMRSRHPLFVKIPGQLIGTFLAVSASRAELKPSVNLGSAAIQTFKLLVGLDVHGVDAVPQPAFVSKNFSWSGYLLGFAMGGFFDGILLHQILQWHHLLSLVDSPLVDDIRTQILADGLFHALMYLIAAVGLCLLWRTQGEFSEKNTARRFLANALIGFGAWNVLDAVLFHWILQIHRIRIESDSPLTWDLIWFFVFGIAFIIAGWILKKKRDAPGPPSDSHARTLLMVTAITVAAFGTLAALPPQSSAATIVLFKADATPMQVSQALDAVDGRILWADRSGTMWAMNIEDKRKTGLLYRHGALLVSNSAVGLGCLSWIKG
jgi:uncharacterized membrane protein